MSAEKDAPPAPFVTYTRWVQVTRDIAEVTEQNIGQIAAVIGGQVDYSEGEPVLIVPGEPQPWRVKVGWTVSLNGGRLMNQNGFNRDGDWSPTPPAPTKEATDE